MRYDDAPLQFQQIVSYSCKYPKLDQLLEVDATSRQLFHKAYSMLYWINAALCDCTYVDWDGEELVRLVRTKHPHTDGTAAGLFRVPPLHPFDALT